MMPNNVLDTMTTPLNTTCLIEASAGTGKTFTISTLYLRLLLQAGEYCFERPLSVEEILVVTFTEAATEELKGRIRKQIYDTKKAFLRYQQEKQQQESASALSEQELQQLKQRLFANDPFLLSLLSAVENQLDLAIERLTLAERTMDLAAIYTIHGFCRRMLMQYAFHSRVYFQFDLLAKQTEVLQQLTHQFWREHFYSQPFVIANYIHQTLKSPTHVFQLIKSHFNHSELSADIPPALLSGSLSQFLQNYILPYLQQVLAFKKQWLDNVPHIEELILAELNKSYKKGEKKSLSRKTFQLNRTGLWLKEISLWAADEADYALPEKLCKYFSQSALNGYAEEGAAPIEHFLFQQGDELEQRSSAQALYEKVLLYRYLQGVQQAFLSHKSNHEKDFNDLLRLLYQALCSPQGAQLGTFIRHQYPFAMIDEFQDTDYQQYGIFAQIYMAAEKQSASGFMMIGDPKQAIYKFRGADIFTYFKAASEAKVRLTLNKNWRSTQALINVVNALFDFNQGEPFIYQQIPFAPVQGRQDLPCFYLNEQIEPALRCYIFAADKNTNVIHTQQKLAEICANSIHHWLQSAVKNQAVFRTEQKSSVLCAERIAVLVRNRYEAASVQKALQRLNIASVYLSDDTNVFSTQVAQDLAWILTACLNPFNERSVFNAIGSTLWGLNVAEISQIKQDELRWTNLVNSFLHYQQIWQRRGVLVMLHHLFLDKKISEKVLAKAGGDRILTDLLHLTELLQQATPLHDTPNSLLRWFEKQLQGEGNKEEQIRLESENQLVKIVTVHKSKGLDYDLVWLPFIAHPAQLKNTLFPTYYDESTESMRLDIENRYLDKVWEETKAEEMRLLYVALTRAKFQIAMALPNKFTTKGGWNALHYALSQGETEQDESEYLLQQLQQKIADQKAIQIEWVSDVQNEFNAQTPMPIAQHQQDLDYAHFSGQIEQNWQITSFSSMEYLHRNATYQRQSAVTFPQFSEKEEEFVTPNSVTSSPDFVVQMDYPLGYSPFDFPAGTQIGNKLHHFLEKQHFHRPIERESVALLCEQLQLEETWIEPVQQWFMRILHTPLLPNEDICLAKLKAPHYLKELDFYLQLKQDFDVDKFNALLAQNYPEATALQLLDKNNSIKGLLRGFIDLVFYHQEKYYILDYKSSLISQNWQDYHPNNLRQVILQQHYHWQYLFYTLALHRYLALRHPNYQYQQHFGGVIYPFLRAMDGRQHYSIYVDKPDEGLIHQLGELF